MPATIYHVQSIGPACLLVKYAVSCDLTVPAAARIVKRLPLQGTRTLITGSLLLVIGLLSLGLIVPLVWLLRVWLEDRLLSTPLALSALAAHGVIFFILATGAPFLGLAYSVLFLLFIAFTPLLGIYHERNTRKAMASEDIIRCRRLLERDANNAAAHAALGDAYMVHAQYDDAIAAYERAIALDPINMRTEPRKLQQARDAREQAGKKRRR